MSDPFHSSKSSIEWAKHNIADLNRQIAAFHNLNPYAHVVDVDSDTGEHLHKIKLTKPLPSYWDNIVADIISNLRHALDRAVYALKPVRNAYFPIAPDKTNFENGVRGRSKHLPQEISDLFRSFKPYKGGNNLLWALNELCTTSKHGIIQPAVIYSGAMRFNLDQISGNVALHSPVWDSAKNEMVIAHTAPDGKFQMNANIATFVAIGNVEFVHGEGVVALLNEFARMVEGIVMTIEAEARRIGLP